MTSGGNEPNHHQQPIAGLKQNYKRKSDVATAAAAGRTSARSSSNSAEDRQEDDFLLKLGLASKSADAAKRKPGRPRAYSKDDCRLPADFSSASIQRKIENIEFSVERSLVDQVKKAVVGKPPPPPSADGHSLIDSYLDAIPTATDQSFHHAVNFRDLELKFAGVHRSTAESRLSCTLDFLRFIGASSVPLDAFVHVLVEFKSDSRKCPANAAEMSADPSSAGSMKQIMNALNAKTDNSFAKFEYLHGDKSYWPVKIRRYFGDLFQLKVSPDSLPGPSKSANTTCNEATNQTGENDQIEAAESAAAHSVSSPAPPPTGHNDSLNHSMPSHSDKFSNAKSLFFLVDTTPQSSALRASLDERLRPLGWSKKHGYRMEKPANFQLATELFSQRRKEADDDDECFTQHFDLDEADGGGDSSEPLAAHKQFQVDSYCELQDELNPLAIDIVRVKKNVGGRLLLSYLETGDEAKRFADVWLFYLDFRVHPLGWAKTSSSSYKYDSAQVALVVTENPGLKSRIDPGSGPEDRHPASRFVLNDHELLNRHDFKVNYLMECLYQDQFYVARVIEVVNEFFFRIEMDVVTEAGGREVVQVACHKNSKNLMRDNGCHSLFPCRWCAKNRLRLVPPRDWPSNKEFNWDEYLQQLNQSSSSTTTAATLNDDSASDQQQHVLLTDSSFFDWANNLHEIGDRFELGAYLECVDRSATQSRSIFLGQIQAKVDHLLFVRPCLPGLGRASARSLRIYPASSFDLFPTGWCEMNNYTDDETPSSRLEQFENAVKALYHPTPRIEFRRDLLKLPLLSMFRHHFNWCHKIFVNTSVHLGPYFSKEKLDSMLPRSFGPAPISLILIEMLQMIINASYKPLRLLKLLQASREKQQLDLPPSLLPLRVRLKARENEKYIYRQVEVCTSTYQLSEYLASLCNKLKCCTSLIALSESPVDPDRGYSRPICSSVNCCVHCTLNYYSFSALTSIPKPKEDEKKVVNLVRHETAKRHLPAQRAIRNLKKRELENHSPIKTRLNVKQTLLLNKYKQQQEQKLKELTRKQQAKEEKALGTPKSNGYSVSKMGKSGLKKSSIEAAESSASKIKKRLVHTPSKYKFMLKNKEGSASKLMHGKYGMLKRPSVEEITDEKSARKVQKRLQKEFEEMEAVAGSTESHSTPPKLRHQNGFSPSGSGVSSAGNSYISNANMASMMASSTQVLINQFNNLASHSTERHQGLSGKNPLEYTIEDVCLYLLENKVDPGIIQLVREQEIDGQSFLMLTLPTIQNYMNLKFGPAIKLSHLVEKLKLTYTQNFKQ